MLETYITDLKASKNKLSGFDEGLLYALVDRFKVNKDGVVIVWKDVLRVNEGLVLLIDTFQVKPDIDL